MTNDELRRIWEKEESIARIEGWDFSHIHGRYEEENALPWDYETIIHEVLRDDMKLLDYDTGGGAFVWFARIIEWEFPGFSVGKCFDRLLELQKTIETEGKITGTTHRFLIVARKPAEDGLELITPALEEL